MKTFNTLNIPAPAINRFLSSQPLTAANLEAAAAALDAFIGPDVLTASAQDAFAAQAYSAGFATWADLIGLPLHQHAAALRLIGGCGERHPQGDGSYTRDIPSGAMP